MTMQGWGGVGVWGWGVEDGDEKWSKNYPLCLWALLTFTFSDGGTWCPVVAK